MRISARDIRIYAHHGVLPVEKVRGQPFLIDFDVELDEAHAPLDDELESTVDYAALVAEVKEISTSRRYNLVESLAADIAEYLVSREGVVRTTVTVKKTEAPLPAPAAWVGVTVTRERP